MKKTAVLALLVLLIGSIQAAATGLITKSQAEQIALNAVGGGTVQQAVLDTNMGRKTWSVDILGTNHEYEVWVDAHTGTVLKIITQPLSPSGNLIPKTQAEQDALNAVGGGTVLQCVRDTLKGKAVWSVDISQSTAEYEVSVDVHTGAILKIVTQPNSALQCTFISKASAEQIALKAVGGGSVIQAILEKNDNPPDWAVDVKATNGKEYEVKVNACNGKVIAIILGG